ncbi:MAG: site-specific integrase [Eubacterium ventriosum]
MQQLTRTNIEELIQNTVKNKKIWTVNTGEAYRMDLSQFCQDISTPNVTDVTSSMLENYISKLRRKYKPTNCKEKIASMSALFQLF